MKKLQHPQSSLAASPSLDVFSVLPTATGLKSFRLREIPCIHPLNDDGPYEIYVQSNFPISLEMSRIYVKFRIFDSTGNPHPATKQVRQPNDTYLATPTEVVAPCQAFAKALFHHATATVDGVTIEDIPLFHMKSFLEFEFSTSGKLKEQMSRNLLYSTVDNGEDDDQNPGYLGRAALTHNGAAAEVYFRPALALFQQDKLWLRNTELRLRFDRNPDSMLLDCHDANQARGGPTFKVKIDDLRLIVTEVDAEIQPVNHIESRLAAGAAACYNLRIAEMRSFHIPRDRNEYEVTLSNSATTPMRVAIAFVPNDSFHSQHKLSVFNFVPANIRQIDLLLSGVPVGYAAPYENDWARKNYLRLFTAHHDALGLGERTGATNDISYEAFGKNRCLYAWSISPNSEDACLNAMSSSILSVKISFAAPVAQALMMVVYLEDTSVLQLSAGRKVITANTVVHV